MKASNIDAGLAGGMVTVESVSESKVVIKYSAKDDFHDKEDQFHQDDVGLNGSRGAAKQNFC
jgi:hypothetical protein